MAKARQQLLAEAILSGARGTYLPPDQEAAYRAWMQAIGHTKQAGFNVDDSYSGRDYDYRGFFKERGPVALGAGEHLTDEYKLPVHPSFSDESRYATGKFKKYAGSWDGEAYKPSLAGFLLGKRGNF